MKVGFIDIQFDEIFKYYEAVKLKAGTCDVLPAGRFWLSYDGAPEYGGLVCHPMDMSGRATGVGAESCKNCILKDDDNIKSTNGEK